ncbi:MAG: hypothetical protein FWG87_09515, partial [Defluviitaleaceae bacterium]|nr:hypothetical protein [Defluviitaleaceae bacterium]
ETAEHDGYNGQLVITSDSDWWQSGTVIVPAGATTATGTIIVPTDAEVTIHDIVFTVSRLNTMPANIKVESADATLAITIEKDTDVKITDITVTSPSPLAIAPAGKALADEPNIILEVTGENLGGLTKDDLSVVIPLSAPWLTGSAVVIEAVNDEETSATVIIQLSATANTTNALRQIQLRINNAIDSSQFNLVTVSQNPMPESHTLGLTVTPTNIDVTVGNSASVLLTFEVDRGETAESDGYTGALGITTPSTWLGDIILLGGTTTTATISVPVQTAADLLNSPHEIVFTVSPIGTIPSHVTVTNGEATLTVTVNEPTDMTIATIEAAPTTLSIDPAGKALTEAPHITVTITGTNLQDLTAANLGILGSSIPAWLTAPDITISEISLDGTSATATIRLAATENATGTDRDATLTITNTINSLTTPVTVTQATQSEVINLGLTIDPETVRVYEGVARNVEVTFTIERDGYAGQLLITPSPNDWIDEIFVAAGVSTVTRTVIVPSLDTIASYEIVFTVDTIIPPSPHITVNTDEATLTINVEEIVPHIEYANYDGIDGTYKVDFEVINLPTEPDTVTIGIENRTTGETIVVGQFAVEADGTLTGTLAPGFLNDEDEYYLVVAIDGKWAADKLIEVAEIIRHTLELEVTPEQAEFTAGMGGTVDLDFTIGRDDYAGALLIEADSPLWAIAEIIVDEGEEVAHVTVTVPEDITDGEYTIRYTVSRMAELPANIIVTPAYVDVTITVNVDDRPVIHEIQPLDPITIPQAGTTFTTPPTVEFTVIGENLGKLTPEHFETSLFADWITADDIGIADIMVSLDGTSATIRVRIAADLNPSDATREATLILQNTLNPSLEGTVLLIQEEAVITTPVVISSIATSNVHVTYEGAIFTDGLQVVFDITGTNLLELTLGHLDLVLPAADWLAMGTPTLELTETTARLTVPVITVLSYSGDEPRNAVVTVASAANPSVTATANIIQTGTSDLPVIFEITKLEDVTVPIMGTTLDTPPYAVFHVEGVNLEALTADNFAAVVTTGYDWLTIGELTLTDRTSTSMTLTVPIAADGEVGAARVATIMVTNDITTYVYDFALVAQAQRDPMAIFAIEPTPYRVLIEQKGTTATEEPSIRYMILGANISNAALSVEDFTLGDRPDWAQLGTPTLEILSSAQAILTIPVTVDANSDTAEREGLLTVMYDGDEYNVEIAQAGFIPTTIDSLIYDGAFNGPDATHRVTFTVSNIPEGVETVTIGIESRDGSRELIIVGEFDVINGRVIDGVLVPGLLDEDGDYFVVVVSNEEILAERKILVEPTENYVLGLTVEVDPTIEAVPGMSIPVTFEIERDGYNGVLRITSSMWLLPILVEPDVSLVENVMLYIPPTAEPGTYTLDFTVSRVATTPLNINVVPAYDSLTIEVYPPDTSTRVIAITPAEYQVTVPFAPTEEIYVVFNIIGENFISGGGLNVEDFALGLPTHESWLVAGTFVLDITSETTATLAIPITVETNPLGSPRSTHLSLDSEWITSHGAVHTPALITQEANTSLVTISGIEPVVGGGIVNIPAEGTAFDTEPYAVFTVTGENLDALTPEHFSVREEATPSGINVGEIIFSEQTATSITLLVQIAADGEAGPQRVRQIVVQYNANPSTTGAVVAIQPVRIDVTPTIDGISSTDGVVVVPAQGTPVGEPLSVELIVTGENLRVLSDSSFFADEVPSWIDVVGISFVADDTDTQGTLTVEIVVGEYELGRMDTFQIYNTVNAEYGTITVRQLALSTGTPNITAITAEPESLRVTASEHVRDIVFTITGDSLEHLAAQDFEYAFEDWVTELDMVIDVNDDGTEATVTLTIRIDENGSDTYFAPDRGFVLELGYSGVAEVCEVAIDQDRRYSRLQAALAAVVDPARVGNANIIAADVAAIQRFQGQGLNWGTTVSIDIIPLAAQRTAIQRMIDAAARVEGGDFSDMANLTSLQKAVIAVVDPGRVGNANIIAADVAAIQRFQGQGLNWGTTVSIDIIPLAAQRTAIQRMIEASQN